MTSQEQKTAQSVDHDIPDTEVIVVSAPSPVFVDSTGRRRRLLRRLSYAFGGLCMLYGGLVSVSLAGGPVSSRAILPLPDLGNAAAAEVRPSPTPQPAVASPKARAIIEALPRRDLPAAGNDRFAATRPVTAPPSPRATGKSATPKPSATSSKPVESTVTPTASASPSTSGSPTPSTSTTSGPTKQPPPISPAHPRTGTGGGSGGSTPSGSGGASAMPPPPAEAPTTDVAGATPAPTPQTPVPGISEFPAPTGGPGAGSSTGTEVPA